MLDLVPLCTAVVEVASPLSIGAGPLGQRSIAAITSVTIVGDRLQATLAGPAAADWMIRSGTYGVIDVRIAIRTTDDALIYVQYGGRLDLSNQAAGFTAVVAATFETGDERYAWLNRIQAIGRARLSVGAGSTARLDYEFYEVC